MTTLVKATTNNSNSPPRKVHHQLNTDNNGSIVTDNNSSGLDMVEEKKRLSEHQPPPPVVAEAATVPPSRTLPSTTTDAAAAPRVPPVKRRVVVRTSAPAAASSSSTHSSNKINPPRLKVVPAAAAAAAAASCAAAAAAPCKVPAPTNSKRVVVAAAAAAAAVHKSSISSTSSSSNSSGDDDNMTVLEILEEKRYLAYEGWSPTPTPSSSTRGTAISTTRSPATTGIRRVAPPSLVGDKKQKMTAVVDDDNTENLPTMPGAVFMPGISSSFYNDDDDDSSDDDDDDDSSDDDDDDADRKLKQGQSSGGMIGNASAAAGESAHLGVAVAVEVDEEQVPQINAIPIIMAQEQAAKKEKKQIPVYKTKLFCRISLIFLIMLITIGVATVTIIILADSDHAEAGQGDDDGNGRENLGIRQVIEEVIGAEHLAVNESSALQSPYVKALEWIIHQDPMQLVPADSNFIQRYIMAYFYYATTTNGPWRSCNPAVGQELEFCYLTNQDPFLLSGNEDGLDIQGTRWLSSVHECKFAGVVCDNKMQVVGLRLNNQQLSGEFPVGIIHLPFLESIEFFFGDLSGPLPKDIAGLEHLVHVDISYQKLSGEIPIEWWQSRFVSMRLGHNELSGSIPSAIKDMEKLMLLHLDGNKFTGIIPKEIGELQSLESLWLYDNSLKGPIPSDFGQLEQLVDLYLYRNQLTGTLPPELGNMTDMWDFRVNHNSLLGGDIPESFYSMKSLWFLDLSECNFTGTISSMIGNLKELTRFIINDNSFTGTIPVVPFPDLPYHVYSKESGVIQVQNNNFQGRMPPELCELRLQTLIADCAPDPVTGEVKFQCDCCTECCDTEGTCTLTQDSMNEWED